MGTIPFARAAESCLSGARGKNHALAQPHRSGHCLCARRVDPRGGGAGVHSGAARVAASGADPAFPPGAPLTPAEVPRGVRAEDPPGVWDQATWKALGFGFDHAHAFSFAFESTPGPRARFKAIAHGDLDGDGVVSTF